MNNLAVVLTNDLVPADPVAVTVALHRQGLEAAAKTLDDGSVAFDLGSGTELALLHIPAPNPQAAQMRSGPTTPPVDEIASARAHIVVGALHLDRLVGPEQAAIDLLMMQVTAAVISTTDAIAAMLGHGVYFHEAQLFATLTVVHSEHGQLPPQLAINVTTGESQSGRTTLLTHGLARYGRMELLVGCTADLESSTAFIWQMIEWLMASEIHRLVPGTLVPGDDGTDQVAGALPSPLGDGSTVVSIELGRAET